MNLLRLETFQRTVGVLWPAAFVVSILATLLDPDEKSPLVAVALILTTVLFTAWMIARSISHRRRLISLSKVLSQLPDSTVGPEPAE